MTATRRILHHWLKDLRALAPLLKIWLALVLITAAASPFIGWTRSPALLFYALVPGVVTMMGLVFMIIVQFQDPVRDTEAAWQSRPLRSGELLAAKLLFALPVVLLLVAQDIVALAASGAGWASLLGVPRNLLLFVPAALGFFAIGSLARSGRDLLVVSAAFIVLAILMFTVADRVSHTEAGRIADAAVARDDALRASRMIVVSVLASVVALATAVHQFRTRRTWISGGILLAGTVAVALTASFWPWRLFSNSPSTRIAQADVQILEPITIAARPDSVAVQRIETVDRFGRTINRTYRLSAIISVDNLPPDCGTDFVGIASRIALPDGGTITSTGSNPLVSNDADDAIAEVERLTRVDRNRGAAKEHPSLTVSRGFDLHLASLSEEDFERIKGEPVDLAATIEIAASRWGLVGEAPLVEGRKMILGGQTVVITDIEVGEATRSGHGPEGAYEYRDPQWFKVSFHARRPGWGYQPGQPAWRILNSDRAMPGGDYVLLNRRRGQLLGTDSWGGGSTPRAMSLIQDFDYHTTFHLPPGPSGNAPSEWDASWLDDATLALARRDPVGSVTRTIELKGLRLGDLVR